MITGTIVALIAFVGYLFARYRLRVLREPDIVHFLRGRTVRLVEMRGCMATERANIRTGVVLRVETKQVYGDTRARAHAIIRLSDGATVERCADGHLWTTHTDGTMEYLS